MTAAAAAAASCCSGQGQNPRFRSQHSAALTAACTAALRGVPPLSYRPLSVSRCPNPLPPPFNTRRAQPIRSVGGPKLAPVAAAAAALFLSHHHAADAFFGPARPSLVRGLAAAVVPPTSSAKVALAASAAAASTEESVQRGHFYGYGDPDHVPSILQNITAQRYIGET